MSNCNQLYCKKKNTGIKNFDGRKCNSDEWWNNKKCRCESKKRHLCEKNYVRRPTTYNCENEKYLATVMYDSAIMYDKIKES